MNTISCIAPRLFLTEAQFCAQIGQSAPRVAIEYNRGFLAIDTLRAGSPLSEVDRRELARLSRQAFWAAEKKARAPCSAPSGFFQIAGRTKVVGARYKNEG